MTLKKLRAQVRGTKNLEIPTVKSLLESGETPLIEKELMNGKITVFESGFAIFTSFNASTVLRVDEEPDYKYSFVDGCSELSREDLLNADFSIFITLIGEDRLSHNRKVNCERHECSYSDDICEADAVCSLKGNIEEECLCRLMLEEIYAALTPRQEQIVRLSYEEGLTMREVGKILGISFQAVESTLAAVRKKIRKKYKKF
jgi:RNA polymerase sigma factor (sigma-70 family)